MTRKQILQIMASDTVSELMGHVIATLQRETDEKIKRVQDEANAKIAALEAKMPSIEYREVWRAGQDYRRGNFVTHNGAMWHCNVDHTQSRPGTDKGWKLAVKNGGMR